MIQAYSKLSSHIQRVANFILNKNILHIDCNPLLVRHDNVNYADVNHNGELFGQ